MGPYQTVLIMEVSLVWRLCKPHPSISGADLLVYIMPYSHVAMYSMQASVKDPLPITATVEPLYYGPPNRKDTSIIPTLINGPKRSVIEMCTNLTSELKTPLYSTLDPVPNHHIAIVNVLYNTVKATPPSSITSASTTVLHGLL